MPYKLAGDEKRKTGFRPAASQQGVSIYSSPQIEHCNAGFIYVFAPFGTKLCALYVLQCYTQGYTVYNTMEPQKRFLNRGGYAAICRRPTCTSRHAH